MRSLPLIRTAYWDLNTNTVRSGRDVHVHWKYPLSNETNHGTVLLSGARNLVVTGGVIEWHPPQDTTLQQESMLFATQGIVQEIETLSAQIGKDEGEEKSVGAMTLTTNTALGPSSGYCCVNHAL